MANGPEEQQENTEEQKPRQQRQQRSGSGRGGQSRSQRGDGRAAAPPPPDEPRQPARLLTYYRDEVVPVLRRDFGYTNPMQVPGLTKIMVNIGLGEALTSTSALEAAQRDLGIITGQRPLANKARKSIANFRLREGQVIGTSVTLRSFMMWQFYDRLVNVALPRVRDFRGVSRDSFDGRGNYSLGLREQVVFPEIDYNQIDRLRGLQITIVTTAKTDEEARRLLELLGMPFVRVTEGAVAVA